MDEKNRALKIIVCWGASFGCPRILDIREMGEKIDMVKRLIWICQKWFIFQNGYDREIGKIMDKSDIGNMVKLSCVVSGVIQMKNFT